MADEYTPTTKQVRETYAALCKTDAAADEFDRWLAAHDREVAAKARDEVEMCDECQVWNPYREGGAS